MLQLAMEADQQLLDVLAVLWRIPPPGPDNLLTAPAFVELDELLDRRYGGGKAIFALSNALWSLGLPCGLPSNQSGLALDLSTVATALDKAYSRRMTVRHHLGPLDQADELPTMAFANARVARFTAGELEQLFDAPRLRRNFPTLRFESERLARFHWLTVEEERAVDPRLKYVDGSQTRWLRLEYPDPKSSSDVNMPAYTAHVSRATVRAALPTDPLFPIAPARPHSSRCVSVR